MLIWAPWMTEDMAASVTIKAFEAEWRDVADGCGFNCEGCGVKNIQWRFIGRAVEIEYACGMLPADRPEYHRYGWYYVSPIGTAHHFSVTNKTMTDPAPRTLNGTEWTLVSMHGEPALTEQAVTLSFPNPNEFSGYAGCNYYSGIYATSEMNFNINEGIIERTTQICVNAETVMQQETAYLTALASAVSYQANDSRLEITDDSGKNLVFTRKLPPPVDPNLVGSEWILVSMVGHMLLEDTRITLDFDEYNAGGYAGCNHYGGRYAAANQGALSFTEFTVTAQACESPQGVMEQEAAYIEAINAVTGYQTNADLLELRDDSGAVNLIYERKEDLPMNPARLVDTQWQLVSLTGKPLTGDAVITLTFFTDKEAGGHAACRDYTATYEAEGDNIGFPMLSMSGDDCDIDSELWQQESAYIDLFDRITNYRLSENQLEIISVRNEVLVFIPLQKEQE
jgi:heat shock protein HslJ